VRRQRDDERVFEYPKHPWERQSRLRLVLPSFRAPPVLDGGPYGSGEAQWRITVTMAPEGFSMLTLMPF